MNKIVLRGQFWYWAAYVIKFVLSQEIHKENFVVDSLLTFVKRVGSDSDREFFLVAFFVGSGALKCVVLGTLDEFAKSDVPDLLDNFSDLIVVDLDCCLEQWHCLLIKDLYAIKFTMQLPTNLSIY